MLLLVRETIDFLKILYKFEATQTESERAKQTMRLRASEGIGQEN